MRPEAQRIAIAEACGWKVAHDGPGGDYVGLHPGLHEPDDAPVHLPDYLNDLNAMHEAEKVLTEQQRDDYADNLWHLLPEDENAGSAFEGGPDVMIPSQFTFTHATAAQRAEAFLRTINKWTDQ